MAIVEKDYQITFDLLVKVGELRYQDHRQLEEIKTFLKCSEAKIDWVWLFCNNLKTM